MYYYPWYLFSELVPYFDQNPVSYVSYPTISDAYLEFSIEMSFKPQATDGKYHESKLYPEKH